MSVDVIMSSEEEVLYSSQMSIEDSPWYIMDLYATGPDKSDKVGPAVSKLKNTIIGSNRQKSQALRQGILPQVLNLLGDVNLPSSIRQDACITLGSLVKGTPDNVRTVVTANSIPKLISVLESSDEKLISYSLSCLTTIFSHDFAPTEALFSTPGLIPHLLILMNESIVNQASVATILSNSCKNREQQDSLCQHDVVIHLAPLLCSSSLKVQMPAVSCLTTLAHKNELVSNIIATTRFKDRLVPELLLLVIGRDRPIKLQLTVAKCLTYLHRSNALSATDPKVVMKALPCLVRLCGKDHDQETRVSAAETLAYLIEVDKELQGIAAISNHLIPTLADYLKLPTTTTVSKPLNTSSSAIMIQAAFTAFASLGANDENIRKRIIETDNLMDRVVAGLDDTNEMVELAAVRCLHSLSRSVHLLRTTFKDHSVWKPLMQLLQHPNQEILNVASSTVCNLILEFSPAKEHILNEGAVEKFCELTRHPNSRLRINGIWALMNVAFQADERVKTQILKSLRDIGTDQIFRLLSDSEVMVVMKTLGLLRNLLSGASHIDHIMDVYGTEIMQAAILTLEGDHGPDVKEQALCMLANIADGSSAKEFIMMNEDVLKKITNYLRPMINSRASLYDFFLRRLRQRKEVLFGPLEITITSGNGNTKLQIAAALCISNLAWKEEAGAAERQIKLKEMGVKELLHHLITAEDQALFDRVKTALNQFAPN